MSAFKKVKAPERLLWKQRGGAVVFLESEDDYEIIAKRWSSMKEPMCCSSQPTVTSPTPGAEAARP